MIEEADKFFFFIRPRRFGKSLTVNMLQHYYDILAKDKFEALFGDLYIGKHPTRDRNSYLVLYLNFSGIVGELHNYRKGLDAHCQTMFDYFCDIYADYLPKGIKEELDKKEGAVEQFEYLFTECNKTNQRIYLFIDEYDHFTNAILSDIESLHRYTDETHGEGYLRAFFNKIKAHVRKRCLTVQAPIFFHDMYQLTKDLFFPFRQSQTFFDERIFLHDLCSCKTHRESCFFCIGFDQMNGCMDTSVKRTYRILR